MERRTYVVKPWTEEDESYLEMFHYDEPGELQELADFLGRSLGSVKTKATYLRKKNANIKHLCRPWTDREVNILKNMYPFNTIYEISHALDRSPDAIKIKANRLGIKKLKSVADFDKRIRQLAKKGFYMQKAADLLGLKRNSLYYYCLRHDIHFRKATLEERNKTFRKLNDMEVESYIWHKKNK